MILPLALNLSIIMAYSLGVVRVGIIRVSIIGVIIIIITL